MGKSSIAGAATVNTYLSNIFGRFAAPDVAFVAAEALMRICPGETKLSHQFVQQNSWGVYRTLEGGECGPSDPQALPGSNAEPDARNHGAG